jgi:hypothetical protein
MKMIKILAGALGEIRTPDPRIRSPMLYPAELRARVTVQLSELRVRRYADLLETRMPAMILADIGG